jgi:polygalacturonase
MKGRAVPCLALLAIAGLASAGVPPLPSINTNALFNVTNISYGASTNSADNAAAIQGAINAATAATAGLGGGTVEIPGPGTYLCGPLTLKSKVNLQIDSGATLKMLPYGTWSGTTAFINGSGLHDVEISGSGTIDGQGAAWWAAYNSSGISRPNFIDLNGACARILIQNVTLQNPPTFHIMLKGNNTDITVQGITINTDPSSPNTDGMDIASTNMLIQNCYISDGDDNLEIGGSGGPAAFITVTNCAFGTGHGVSIGGYTSGGISNLTVVNCTFSGTDNGIRMKSDNDRGGVAQNLTYLNLSMTNILKFPILIYSYYDEIGTPTSISPSTATNAPYTNAPVNSKTPIWRNILISNVTATVASGGIAGMIWGRIEMPATNITLSKVNITAPGTFDLYNVKSLQIVDSQITPTAGKKTFTLLNAQFTVSNSAASANPFTLDGIDSTNSLALYNVRGYLSDNNAFAANPITLGGSLLTNGTSLTLSAGTAVNFLPGTNSATVVVTGNLTNNAVLTITNGGGFSAGIYTLFTYTGSFSGTPTLGSTPAGYTYSLTNGAGKVNLVVTSPCVNPTASVSGGGAICSGASVSIPAALTGTQPWNVTWSDGVIQSGITSSPATRSVNHLSTTSYTVTALSDATGCPAGTLSGSALVTVCTNAAPFRIVSVQILSTDKVVLAWDSTPNSVYQVQSADTLGGGNWVTNDTVTAAGAATLWTNTGVANVTQRFYRVVLMQ